MIKEVLSSGYFDLNEFLLNVTSTISKIFYGTVSLDDLKITKRYLSLSHSPSLSPYPSPSISPPSPSHHSRARDDSVFDCRQQGQIDSKKRTNGEAAPISLLVQQHNIAQTDCRWLIAADRSDTARTLCTQSAQLAISRILGPGSGGRSIESSQKSQTDIVERRKVALSSATRAIMPDKRGRSGQPTTGYPARRTKQKRQESSNWARVITDSGPNHS
ncbi:hypothetical protein J6590_033883 [Homalodisca vitripennis]|nr:hypothetical protein J6590_033883 [Homalodisca vitripennis]